MILHQSSGRSSYYNKLFTLFQLYFSLQTLGYGNGDNGAVPEYDLQAVAVVHGGGICGAVQQWSMVVAAIVVSQGVQCSTSCSSGDTWSGGVSAGAVPWLNEVRVVGMSTDVLVSQSGRTFQQAWSS